MIGRCHFGRAGLTTTSAPASAFPRANRFPALGGCELVGRSWPASDPPRAAFVLVPGLQDPSPRYEPPAPQLGGAGFAVSAFDPRGPGRSEGPRACVRSFTESVTDLAT